MKGRTRARQWLRADGCCDGSVWVAVNSSPRGTIFLMRGWKYFTHSRGLGPEHLIHFKFDGETMLSVRFFGSSGSRLYCCAESSCDIALDTSNDDQDDDSLLSAKLEGNDSE
ncbi:hypothetical protein D1007_26711 [Hordeum vulgare]|nr:hypothetical protein D1007_26711 [Hordeum vulgare]